MSFEAKRGASGGGARALLMAGLAGCGLLAVPAAASSTSTAGHGWRPEAAVYAVGKKLDVPITMADGVVLRADVYFPADKVSGKAVSGRFPVVLTQTPYGKDSGDGLANNPLVGPFPYLVQRGYIDAVVDVRGTGDSQGVFGLFDPAQVRDSVRVVSWAARLPDSNGKVGLYGESYLAINQLLTAAAVGPHSPVKAIFPVVAGNDLYRDISFFGGAPDTEFLAEYLGFTGGLAVANPPTEAAQSSDPSVGAAGIAAAHPASAAAYWAQLGANIETGGDAAYDESYWRTRSPASILAKVVHNGIPAFLVGGWYDVFQHGELLNYLGLQNAYFGRPVDRPMAAGEPVTSRYQLLMGPWYHLTAPTGINLPLLELRWFDKWLKGENTGVDRTDPLHLGVLGTGSYRDTGVYPFPAASVTTLYLGAGRTGSDPVSTNDGALLSQRPTVRNGADPVVFTAATSPCDRPTDQWSTGIPALALQTAGTDDPCANDDRTLQTGPAALSYTTAPLHTSEVIAGPVDVSVYLTSTRPETFLEATLEDIAPDGQSTPVTAGGLLGSLRATNSGQSWYVNDKLVLPFHPYTQRSQTPVPMNVVTRLNIEVFPTFAEIAKGHRLRLTLTTADSPHLEFTPDQLAGLAGGSYSIERNSTAASFVDIPLAPVGAFPTTCQLCTTAS